MNKAVMDNYAKLSLVQFFVPLFLLLIVILYLYIENALYVDSYVEIQKEWFLLLNSILSKFPEYQYNLTQFGDAFIFMSLLTIFIIYAPKIWEALLSSSFVSVIFCTLSKKIFAVPRPAVVYEENSFVIIGKKLSGYNSLPSGHSMTVFTIFTILLFAFMPQKLIYKIFWIIAFVLIGLVLVLTRVGVGAHYPIDVLVGSIIGYICGLSGVFISRKFKIWSWINHKKYYPFFIILFTVSVTILIKKMSQENLIIYYFPLISLLITLYIMIQNYVKK